MGLPTMYTFRRRVGPAAYFGPSPLLRDTNVPSFRFSVRMYSRASLLAIYRGRMRGGERIIQFASDELPVLPCQGVVCYVFLQDGRRGEEDPNVERFQICQRPKAPSIEQLTTQPA
jgi:hypothetical protein